MRSTIKLLRVGYETASFKPLKRLERGRIHL